MNKQVIFLGCIFWGLTIASCGGDGHDDIPDRVQPEPTPTNPTTPAKSEYNSLGDDFVPHKSGDPYNTYKREFTLEP